jgi:hypothetical protein
MYGYADPGGPRKWWKDDVQYGVMWDRVVGTFTIVEGMTRDAAFVKRLRSTGQVFAHHVSNPPFERTRTTDELVAAWTAPFENTLGGGLAGGFDAIMIDEFRPEPDRSPAADRCIDALRRVRERYPDRLILVSGMWRLADGGPGSRRGDRRIAYDGTLRAIRTYADLFVLETYQRTANPQLHIFDVFAKNLEERVPGLLRKTIYALLVARTPPNDAGDDPRRDLAGFLDEQVRTIRAGGLTRAMPGVGYWVFYRSTPETIAAAVETTRRAFPHHR